MSQSAISFPLYHPVDDGAGGTISVLNVRRTKAKDFRGLVGITDKTEIAIILISRAAGISRAIAEEIDGEDFRPLCDLIGADVEKRFGR